MTLPLLGSYQQPHFSDPTLPYRVKRVVNVKKIHAMTLFYKYLGRTPIISKIHKLLALAKDGSDEESQTAILHARKLMMKHDIIVSDISDIATSSAKEIVNDKVFRTKVLWWHLKLANVITSHFRCSNYQSVYGSYDKEIRFVGLKEDVEIARTVFMFAVESIKYHSNLFLNRKDIRRKWKRKHQFKNDYIEGYINGLNRKFHDQNISESLDLAIVQDKLVVQYFHFLKLVDSTIREPNKAGDQSAWLEGFEDGKRFEKDKLKIR